MKYIYFEITYISPGADLRKIENENVLLIQPYTNSDGYWGHSNVTKMRGYREGIHEDATFKVVNQHWIDLEKYNNSKTDFLRKEVKQVIEKLKNKL